MGKVVVAPGSAGSPASQLPRDDLVQKVKDVSLTQLDILASQFPLELPEGGGRSPASVPASWFSAACSAHFSEPLWGGRGRHSAAR